DIKVYYTRMDDSNPGEEDRVRLANETRADMYIRIQVDANEDSSVYGATTIYNEDYFIPGFGSVELADILEREVVTSIKGKALGLTGAEEEDYAVRSITVPAAAVKVGCLTNKQEAILLGREEYQDKIADGICNAVQKVYEDKNQPGG
ncbi:MAG: N-acetylmuramoyl-L-alanine amidase, partial [Lachnospiraceae bacterium]|nr:N-acetylmuramoyl-L-alanine amidase [Lachnospiraceae bacterium]